VLPRGPEPRLLSELSSNATTRSSASDFACLSRWASTLPRVPWLRALPPREEISGAVTCSSAPDIASLPRWAPALPCGPGLASSRGELRCYHISHGPQRVVHWYAAGLACVQSTVMCYRGACMTCGQAATVQFNSVTQSQLITLRHGYNCDTTRQDGTTTLTIFSIAG
jgi:hypothetical protein